MCNKFGFLDLGVDEKICMGMNDWVSYPELCCETQEIAFEGKACLLQGIPAV